MKQKHHGYHVVPAVSFLRSFLIMLFLFLASAQLLRANLPHECPQCSGTEEECNCDEEEIPLDGDGAVDGEKCCENEGIGFGSVRLTIPFGRPLHEELNLQSQFSLYAISASPLVYTTQYLQYRNRLLDRILQTRQRIANASSVRTGRSAWRRSPSSGAWSRTTRLAGTPPIGCAS